MSTENRLQHDSNSRLELVVELVDGGDIGLETLAGTDRDGESLDLGSLLDGGTSNESPVIEDGLGEGCNTRKR